MIINSKTNYLLFEKIKQGDLFYYKDNYWMKIVPIYFNDGSGNATHNAVCLHNGSTSSFTDDELVSPITNYNLTIVI